MPRPTKTFLIEAGSLQFRVDLTRKASGYSVTGVYRSEGIEPNRGDGLEDFDAFESMSDAMDIDWVAPLLKQRPKPAPEITILSDKVAAIVAEMPVGPGEDWRSSAEMEVQTISGLSSSEAMTASTRLPAESGLVSCWVVQVAMRDIAGLRNAVATAKGSRLVSVGHPAGIRLDPAAPQLEYWSEFALFHAGGGDRINLRGWNGPQALEEALYSPDVAEALALTAPPSNLVSIDSNPRLEEDSPALRLDLGEEEALNSWAAGLAKACDPLSGRLLGMPLLSVPKPPATTGTLVATASGITLVALLLIGVMFLATKLNRTRLESELNELKAPAEKLAADQKKITELKSELEELEEAKKNDGTEQVDVFAHRLRLGALLDGISAGSYVEEAVVTKLAPDGLTTIVTGVATTFNAPQEVAGRIDAALEAQGWRAALVRRTAKLLREDGGPWSYEIRLTPDRPLPEASVFDKSRTGSPDDLGANTAEGGAHAISF